MHHCIAYTADGRTTVCGWTPGQTCCASTTATVQLTIPLNTDPDVIADKTRCATSAVGLYRSDAVCAGSQQTHALLQCPAMMTQRTRESLGSSTRSVLRIQHH